MASSRQALRGRRGWLAVASLTLALGTILGSQAVSAAAGDALTPVAASTPLSPSVADSPSPAAVESPAAALPAAVVPAPKATKAAKPAKKATPARTATADVCSGPGWQTKRGQAAMATLRDN